MRNARVDAFYLKTAFLLRNKSNQRSDEAMAVFRVEKNKGYTVMSNHHLRNKELSLKAKGLLSQIERDCDTSKNLRTIPVTNTQLIMAKISMLFIFSVAFCLISTLSVALFCKLFHVGMVYGMTYKIFMSLIFGVLIVAASLPIVFLIIYFNKSFLLSILLAFFYSIFNWGILGTIGTSISAAKIAFLNSFPVICVMNWTSGLMMDNLQKDNLLPEAYAIVPTTCHTIFIMAITVILSLWLIIRFYKKWTR